MQNFSPLCVLNVHKDNVFVCIDKENGEKIQFKADILIQTDHQNLNVSLVELR